MTKEQKILKLFAHQTAQDPLEVELSIEFVNAKCIELKIKDPLDLISGMIINKSIVRYYSFDPENNNGFECIRLLENGLIELREIYKKS